MNLLDSLKSCLGSDTLGPVSQMLGVSPDKAQSAVGAALPTLLAGLSHVASSSPDGAR